MQGSKRKGFTLVELICVVACIMLLSMVVTNVLGMGVKGGLYGNKEFDQQAAFRVATETVSNQLRYSTAIFILPQSSFNATNLSPSNISTYLTAGWDYFGLVETMAIDSNGISVPATEIVEYVWNGSSHSKKVIVPARADMTYELVFDKRDNLDMTDKTVMYRVVATNNSTGDTYFEVDTKSRAANALQVVNWAGGSSDGVAIAYRADDRERGTEGVASGKVICIVDVSGSMSGHINSLRNAVGKLADDLASTGAIQFTIIPFDSDANLKATKFSPSLYSSLSGSYASNGLQIFGTSYYRFFDLSDPNEYRTIKSFGKSLITSGCTNTGDGIRRAYETFEAEFTSSAHVKNYVILMVDGDTNEASLEPFNPTDPMYIGLRITPGDLNYTGYRPGTGYDYASNSMKIVMVKGGASQNCSYSDAVAKYAQGWVPQYLSSYSRTSELISYDYGIKGAGGRYIELHAKRIMDDFAPQPYIIAYTSGVSASSIQHLKSSFTSGGITPMVWTAADSGALMLAFDEIGYEIINDPWFIDGPNQSAP